MKRLDFILRGGLYRSRHGVVMGVCRGVAEYFDFSVFWTRAITLFLFLVTGFWPIGVIYFVAALILKPEPTLPLRAEEEKDFYDSYTHSRRAAVERLKRRFDNLNRRLQRMEHVVTSKEYDWDNRLNT